MVTPVTSDRRRIICQLLSSDAGPKQRHILLFGSGEII